MDRVRGDDAQNSGAGRLPAVAYAVAIGLIIVYIAFVALAWGAVGETAEDWADRIGLLGGLEALAFSAAGAILGVAVQRPAAKAAEKRAKDNEKAADAGRAVIAAARAKAHRAGERVQTLRESDSFERGFESEFQELVDIADEAGRP